jgi:DNA-binding CsgD family transcriptional regulator
MTLLVQEERLERAFDVIDRGFAASTPEELDQLMKGAFAEFGARFFSVDQMRDSSGAIVGIHHFGQWPDDWGAHYIEQRHYLHDRVVRQAIVGPRPRHWVDEQLAGDLSHAEKRLFGEAGDFGLRDGFVTPVHQIDGAVASVVVTASEKMSLSATDRAALRLLSIYYCSFGLLLKHGLDAKGRARNVLTPRQRECLQWARAGKSSWEIGEIIGIAERTVNFHIEEACRRLNVATRQQAVIEAVIKGMISL